MRTPYQQVCRPLVGIAVSWVTGLGVQHAWGGSPLLFLGVTAGALSWACRVHERRGVCAALYLACLFLAAASGSLSKIETPFHTVLPTAEVLFLEQDLIGRIDESPIVSSQDGTLSFRFKAEAVCFGTRWFRSDSVLRVSIKNPDREVAYGEQWRIQGHYTGYEDRRAGLEGFLYATDAIRLQKAAPSFKAICYKARHRASRILCAGRNASPEKDRLLHALLLGYRGALSPELYRRFAYTGTLHIFAISGLHVGVMATLLIAALKWIGVSRPIWGIFLIPALFFYVISTGMKPSAFRAFTMAAVYFSAPLFGRRPDPASAIALAAILLLAIDPRQMMDPGFILSFTVVSGIIMVHGYLRRRLSHFSRRARGISWMPLSGSRSLVAGARTVGLLATTSIAAWLFATPLTARFFNTLSLFALVGNLAVIPLAFILVLTGCLTLLAAPCSLFVMRVFHDANQLFISGLMSIIQWIETVPGSYLFVRSPSMGIVATLYMGLILFFTGTARLKRPALLLFLGSVFMWGVGTFQPFSGIEIHPAGRRAMAIRISPMRWVLVTDGSASGLAQSIRCLQQQGINRLHAIVVKGRRAEAEPLRQLCRIFSPKQVWISPKLQDGQAADLLQKIGIPVTFSYQPRWDVGTGIFRISSY